MLNCVFLMLLGPFDVSDGRAESLKELRQPCVRAKHGEVTENSGPGSEKTGFGSSAEKRQDNELC